MRSPPSARSRGSTPTRSARCAAGCTARATRCRRRGCCSSSGDGGGAMEVAELKASLDMDAGQLSRLLARLDDDGLVARARADHDARKQVLKLTAKGRREHARLDRGAVAQWSELLEDVDDGARARLVGAMGAVQQILGAERAAGGHAARRPDPATSAGSSSATARCTSRSSAGARASRRSARGSSPTSRSTGERERFARGWIARPAARPPAASCASTASDDGDAKLRLLLVEPWARGLGVGGTLDRRGRRPRPRARTPTASSSGPTTPSPAPAASTSAAASARSPRSPTPTGASRSAAKSSNSTCRSLPLRQDHAPEPGPRRPARPTVRGDGTTSRSSLRRLPERRRGDARGHRTRGGRRRRSSSMAVCRRRPRRSDVAAGERERLVPAGILYDLGRAAVTQLPGELRAGAHRARPPRPAGPTRRTTERRDGIRRGPRVRRARTRSGAHSGTRAAASRSSSSSAVRERTCGSRRCASRASTATSCRSTGSEACKWMRLHSRADRGRRSGVGTPVAVRPARVARA